ncbi:MAG: zf-HC2 domain-containing protein [Myxococcaceae bacterium]|nr:zf-HC2 domain-containing protein [Myxococcaceae bacterium]
MSELCKELDAFIDGELDPVSTENFRHHLTHCADCAIRLRDSIHLELLATGALTPTQPAPARYPSWRAMRLGVAGMALAAGIALWLVFTPRQPAELPEDWLAQAPQRLLEARLSYHAADRHRPYVPLRSGGTAPTLLPLQQLAILEEQGDSRGIAMVYLLHGDLARASSLLARQPPSADRDNDQAVIALQQGRLEEAHALLAQALAAQPRHPQTLWNRGLVLRELGLSRHAEETFEQLAELAEPGWSEEALSLAASLRRKREERATAHQAAIAALLERLSQPGAPLPLASVRQQPELLRAALYEAVRTAPSPERVLALLPLAEELDRLQGDTLLQRYVSGVAARDFSLRAPLARAYALLLGSESPEPAALREQLRRAGERDLLLGALLHAPPHEVDLDELAALANEAQDPRFLLWVERIRARREQAQGHAAQAEQRLLSALRTCRARLPPAACMAED